jgi:hypothetical protein
MVCGYYNLKNERCNLETMTSADFCPYHNYIADDPKRLLLNEKRKEKSIGNGPQIKIKAKLKIKPVAKAQQTDLEPPKRFIKAKLKPLLTKEQCIKWQADVTINPVTERIIKVGGPTFTKFQKACSLYGIDIKAKEGSWTDIYGCKNDTDPVGGDQYAQLHEDEVNNLIRLGSGMCYPLDTLYGWYKTKVQESEDGSDAVVTDPMIPSYILSDNEIAIINKYMSENNHDYEKPKQKKKKFPPAGYNFSVDQNWNLTQGIHNVYIHRPDGSLRIIGTLPMRVDECGGSSSYAVMQKLYDAWSKGILLLNNNPEGLTGLHMLDATAGGGFDNQVWWNGNSGYVTFDPMVHHETRLAVINNLQKLDMDLDFRFWEN